MSNKIKGPTGHSGSDPFAGTLLAEPLSFNPLAEEKQSAAVLSFPLRRRKAGKPRIHVKLPEGRVLEFRGQQCKTIVALIDAGPGGVTAQEVAGWGFRLAAYVHSLRGAGVEVAMDREPHPGGWHGRYRLVTSLEIVGAWAHE